MIKQDYDVKFFEYLEALFNKARNHNRKLVLVTTSMLNREIKDVLIKQYGGSPAKSRSFCGCWWIPVPNSKKYGKGY